MDAKLQELCRQAHEDRIRVGMLDTDTKNRTLELAADALSADQTVALREINGIRELATQTLAEARREQ